MIWQRKTFSQAAQAFQLQLSLTFQKMKLVTESLKALPYLMVWYLNSVMKKKDLPWKEIADEFKEEFCIKDSDCKGHDHSVYNKIQIVYTELKALSLRGKKAQEFTNKEFKSPSDLEGHLNVIRNTPPK